MVCAGCCCSCGRRGGSCRRPQGGARLRERFFRSVFFIFLRDSLPPPAFPDPQSIQRHSATKRKFTCLFKIVETNENEAPGTRIEISSSLFLDYCCCRRFAAAASISENDPLPSRQEIRCLLFSKFPAVAVTVHHSSLAFEVSGLVTGAGRFSFGRKKREVSRGRRGRPRQNRERKQKTEAPTSSPF